jgi:hypothetical protein
VPYKPLIGIGDILNSTLYLMEHTDYPQSGHPALEHLEHALRQAIDAVRELEKLQTEAEVAKLGDNGRDSVA